MVSDIAGKEITNHESLVEVIQMAVRLFEGKKLNIIPVHTGYWQLFDYASK